MSTDEKIKQLLKSKLKTKKFNTDEILVNNSRDEIIRIFRICEDDGFLSHKSRKGQLLISSTGANGYMIHPTTYVTRKGEEFLEEYDRNSPKNSTVFNIENISNSALGDYNTVNNYSEQPIDDLLKFMESLDSEDKSEGEKLIDTLKNNEAKPGYLSKFDSFFKKHPKTIDLISSFFTSIFISKSS